MASSASTPMSSRGARLRVAAAASSSADMEFESAPLATSADIAGGQAVPQNAVTLATLFSVFPEDDHTRIKASVFDAHAERLLVVHAWLRPFADLVGIDDRRTIAREPLEQMLTWFQPLVPVAPGESCPFYSGPGRGGGSGDDDDDDLDDEELYENAGAVSPYENLDSSANTESFKGRTYGYSPFDVACVLAAPWFHGYLSVKLANARLAGKKAGSFLCRFSSTKPHFALAVTDTKGAIKNYRLQRCDQQRLKLFDHTTFANFEELLAFHAQRPITIEKNGDSGPYLIAGVPRNEALLAR